MGSPFMTAMEENAASTFSSLPGSNLAWLDEARHRQLDAFLRDGLPGSRNEAWKYTTLRALERHAFVNGDDNAQTRDVDLEPMHLPGVGSVCLVFVNGVFRADLSQLDTLPKGVEIEPLSLALAGNPEPLRFFLTRHWEHQSDAFARINAAFANDGMVLRVAENVQVDEPVHVLHIGTAADHTLAWHTRNIIEIGENARLSLVEHHATHQAHAHLATFVCDAVVREKGHLDWVMLQDAAAKATIIRRHSLCQDAGATINIHALELGSKLSRNDISSELRGPQSALNTRGVFLPHARQHLDTHLDIRHCTTDSSSDSLWRGVADQGGHGVFHGQIIVDAGADGTDASLYNKNLLLSRKAAIDTQPVLEIYADEVMAMHGATVGQLDDEALFYLRSRGVPQEQAQRVLTVAFCREALSTLDNAPLRDYLEGRLLDVLPVSEKA